MPDDLRVRTSLLRIAETDFRVQVIEHSFKDQTQDAVLVADGFVAVADGASPLGVTPAIDPGVFAAASLRALHSFSQADTTAMFARAIEDVRPLAESGDHLSIVSCTVGLLHVTANQMFEACALGDCTAVIRMKDGKSLVVTDQRLRDRDDLAADELKVALNAGLSEEDAFKAIIPTLRRHRSESNKPGSYWVLSNDPGAALEVFRAEVTPADVEGMLLFTDGLSHLITPFQRFSSPEGLYDEACSKGLPRPMICGA
jgi:hypothetical protein